MRGGLPLALATAQALADRQARTAARRVALFLLYLFALSVGANGVGGFVGHLFRSDAVAAAIGRPAGSPFQREMAFANLALGVLGFLALGRRDGFRAATVVAVAILGVGATAVHVADLLATGNLAPGNTAQHLGNLLDPLLLAALLRAARRAADADEAGAGFARWQARQAGLAGLGAAAVSAGFGLGYALGAPLPWTLLGDLAGAAAILVAHRGGAGATGRAARDRLGA